MTVMQTKLDDFRALSSNLRKAVNKYKMRFRRNSIRKFEVIASSNFRGVSQERKLSHEISWHFRGLERNFEPKRVPRHKQPCDSPYMRSEGGQKLFFFLHTLHSSGWFCRSVFLTKQLLTFLEICAQISCSFFHLINFFQLFFPQKRSCKYS